MRVGAIDGLPPLPNHARMNCGHCGLLIEFTFVDLCGLARNGPSCTLMQEAAQRHGCKAGPHVHCPRCGDVAEAAPEPVGHLRAPWHDALLKALGLESGTVDEALAEVRRLRALPRTRTYTVPVESSVVVERALVETADGRLIPISEAPDLGHVHASAIEDDLLH